MMDRLTDIFLMFALIWVMFATTFMSIVLVALFTGHLR